MKNSSNKNLSNAKKAKNDEFYTQYQDIEKEISAAVESLRSPEASGLPVSKINIINSTKYGSKI